MRKAGIDGKFLPDFLVKFVPVFAGFAPWREAAWV
jgi:hypothetical protein